MSDKELAALQTSKSDWHARRARVILQGRAARGNLDAAAYSLLREIYQSNPDADLRLKAMWTLHVTKGLNPAMLLKALGDKDENIRALAIQL
jgi:hypothetical protein